MERRELTRNIEALRLQFPDKDIFQLRNFAFATVSGLLRKHWFIDSKAVLSGEGGMNQMGYSCLCEVLIAPSPEEGVKRYTSFLAKQYGSGNKDAQTISLEALGEPRGTISINITGQRASGEVSLDSPTSVLLNFVKQIGPPKRNGPPKLSELEVELLDTYASVGSWPEAARIVGIGYERARSMVQTIRRRLRPSSPTESIIGDAFTP